VKGGEYICIERLPKTGLFSIPRWYMNEYRRAVELTDKRKPKNSEKTCPSATLPTTDPKWTALGVNPRLYNEKTCRPTDSN
jgi:hypothetical protein